MNNLWKYIGIILGAILPITGLAYFTGIYDFNLYHLFWCGFYGCIIICIFFKSTVHKSVAIISNSAVLLLCAFGALMGGMSGLLFMLLHMLIPFYSMIHTLIV